MHKSLCLPRQGTFETGLGEPDLQGNVRRGEVELPVVVDTRLQQASENPPVNPPGKLPSNPPSNPPPNPSSNPPSNPLPDSQSKPSADYTSVAPTSVSDAVVESRQFRDQIGKSRPFSELVSETPDSSRYVDHNKLFADSPIGEGGGGKGKEGGTKGSQNGVSGTLKAHNGKPYEGNKSQVPQRKQPGNAGQRTLPQTKSNSFQRQDAEKQESQENDNKSNSISESKRDESSLYNGHDRVASLHKDEVNAHHTSLLRTKIKQKPNSNVSGSEKPDAHKTSSISSQHQDSLKRQSQKQNSTHPQTQADRNKASYTSTANVAKSSGTKPLTSKSESSIVPTHPHKNSLHQQHSQPVGPKRTLGASTESLAPSKQLNQTSPAPRGEKQPKNDVSSVHFEDHDSIDSETGGRTSKTFYEAFSEAPPRVEQVNPFLLSTHPSSTPPLDHHRVLKDRSPSPSPRQAGADGDTDVKNSAALPVSDDRLSGSNVTSTSSKHKSHSIKHTSSSSKDTSHGNKDTSTSNKDTSPSHKYTSPSNRNTSHNSKDTSLGNKDTSHGNKYTSSNNKDTSSNKATSSNKNTSHDSKDLSSNNKGTSHGSKDASPKNKDTSPNHRVSSPGRTDASSDDTATARSKVILTGSKEKRFVENKKALPSQPPHRVQPGSTMTTRLDNDRRGGADPLDQMTQERDQLLRNERTYKQRILQLEEEVKGVVSQSQLLSSENRELREALDARNQDTESLHTKDLTREKQELHARLTVATSEKEELRSSNDALKTRLNDLETKSKQWESLYVENNRLKGKQAEVERRLEQAVRGREEAEGRLQAREEEQKVQVAEMLADNVKLKAELSNALTKNQDLEKKVESLQKEKKAISDELEKKTKDFEEQLKLQKTEAESTLTETQAQLDTATTKLNQRQKDAEDAKHELKKVVQERDSLKTSFKAKDTELKELKASAEKKDAVISDLRTQLETTKRNLKRLEESAEESKQAEKDAVNLKARIRSLKNEIEDSLAAGARRKQEKEEAEKEAEKAKRELALTTESLNEARRHVKRLEADKTDKEALQDQLNASKKREEELKNRVEDLTAENDQLKNKLQEMENEKADAVKIKEGAGEKDELNKRLAEENQRLRQVLVERGMEATQRQWERTELESRIGTLEQRQQDADVRVRQLKGWVDSVHTTPPQPFLPPPALSHPQSTVPGGVRGKAKRGRGHRIRPNQLNRSWEDLNPGPAETEEQSARTSPGLPSVTGGYSEGSPGYFHLYRNRVKLLKERKW